MEPVRTQRSKPVAEAARLHRARERKRQGLTLIEGPNLLHEAVAGGATIRTLFVTDGDEMSRVVGEANGIDVIVVDDGALKRLSATETPRGPIGVVEIPLREAPDSPSILVSWGVSDPGNVGTMIRIAAGFGWGFGHHQGSADPWAPKVLRAGAGYQFRTPISLVSDLDELRTAGFKLLATVVDGGIHPADVPPGRWAVLIGEEASGLPPGVASVADCRVSIPMPGGIESLNAGVAAGIVAYELSKHIEERGGQG